MSFKTTKFLVPKSLAPFKTPVCIKPSVSGILSNGAVSYSINTSQPCVSPVQHSICNSKEVADLASFSSLGKFHSFICYHKMFSNISVLTGITFDVMLLVLSFTSLLFSVFRILKYLSLLTQSNRVVLNLNFLAYILLMILYL